MDYTVHGILQARILEWVAFPLSRDLPNPGIKPRSPTLQVGSLPAEPQGKPKLEWVTCPFSRGSSRPRNQTRVSCIAGGFFTNWAVREAQYTYRGRDGHSYLRNSLWQVFHTVCALVKCYFFTLPPWLISPYSSRSAQMITFLSMSFLFSWVS